MHSEKKKKKKVEEEKKVALKLGMSGGLIINLHLQLSDTLCTSHLSCIG